MFHVKQRVLTNDLLRDFDILANSRYIGVVFNHLISFSIILDRFLVILLKFAVMLPKYSSFFCRNFLVVLPKFQVISFKTFQVTKIVTYFANALTDYCALAPKGADKY